MDDPETSPRASPLEPAITGKREFAEKHPSQAGLDDDGNFEDQAMRIVPPTDPTRLVRQLIAAEKTHLTHQIEALRSLRPSERFTTHRLADDSLTILSSPRFGWKLNHTVGFGMIDETAPRNSAVDSATRRPSSAGRVGNTAISRAILENALANIETQYGDDNPPRIDVCEFADSKAREVLLSQGGYESNTRIETFALDLNDRGSVGSILTEANGQTATTKQAFSQTAENGSEVVEVQQYKDGEGVREFIEASVAGFRSGGRSPELLGVLAESAAHRPDTRRYRALVNGQLAGTAGLAIFDVVGTKVATLYIDSTLPEFRGKGVHGALLHARLAVAKQAGCDVVTGSAREGSGSSRNLQKAGLQRAYVCESFTRIGVPEAADAKQ